MQHGLYGNDPDVDFETDAACDGHQVRLSSSLHAKQSIARSKAACDSASHHGRGMAALAIQEWRNAWVKAFAGDEAAKKEYNDKRDFYYGAFECYYRQRTNQDGPFMVKGGPLCMRYQLWCRTCWHRTASVDAMRAHGHVRSWSLQRSLPLCSSCRKFVFRTLAVVI